MQGLRHDRPMHAYPPPATHGLATRQRVMADAQALGVPADYGRTRQLRPMREPARLTFVGLDTQCRPAWLRPAAAAAFARMRRAAASEDIDLLVVSAWRSFEYQLGIIRQKRERGLDMEAILKASAAPGYSEHHTGRALDFGMHGYPHLEEAFDESPAFAWLQRHAGRFGFALSYPRHNRHGITYEPWHWCWHAGR